MPDYEQSVFISYAWGGEREDIVNEIDETLQQRGIRIVRDKRVLGYRGSIKDFMERIGRGSCVIVVISDKYLRSPNCMFELVEIAENKQFHDRIFPVVLSDANIYDPLKRIEYIKFWEGKRKELAKAMKTLDPANLHGIREEMDQYDRIRDKISGITSILKDMNTLTPDMHRDSEFSNLYDAIIERLQESSTDVTTEFDEMAKKADREAKAEAERIARAEANRLAARKAEEERLAIVKAEEERKAKEEAEEEQLAQARADREAKEEIDRLAAQKAEEERIAQQKLEAERLAAQKAEEVRLAAQKAEEERVALAKAEADRLATQKIERERIEREMAEAERLAAQKAEADHRAAQKAERERIERERAEQERLAQAKEEADRLAAQKAEDERIERERAEQERLALARAQEEHRVKEEAERLAAQKAEEERLAKLEAERQAKHEAERIAAQKAERERRERERAEQERLAQAKAEVDRLAKQKAEEERLAKAEAARLTAQKAEAQRLAKQKAEEERAAKVKAEAERKAKQKAPVPAMPVESEAETLFVAPAEKKPASRVMMYGIAAVLVLAIVGIGISALSRGGNNNSPSSNLTAEPVIGSIATEALPVDEPVDQPLQEPSPTESLPTQTAKPVTQMPTQTLAIVKSTTGPILIDLNEWGKVFQGTTKMGDLAKAKYGNQYQSMLENGTPFEIENPTLEPLLFSNSYCYDGFSDPDHAVFELNGQEIPNDYIYLIENGICYTWFVVIDNWSPGTDSLESLLFSTIDEPDLLVKQIKFVVSIP